MVVKFILGDVHIGKAGRVATKIPAKEFPALWDNHTAQDPLTKFVEDFSSRFIGGGLPLGDTFLFVRLVCAWGGLRGTNPKLLYKSQSSDGFVGLRTALIKARDLSISGQYREGIKALEHTDGTGISFQSKLLKFLSPDNAVVLDSKIRGDLGYRESAEDYAEFVTDCVTVRDHLNKQGILRSGASLWRTSDVEMAIFKKINP